MPQALPRVSPFPGSRLRGLQPREGEGRPTNPAIPPGELAKALDPLLAKYPPQVFERGETLLENSLLQTTDFADPTAAPAGPEDPSQVPHLGYVIEGLVRGVWDRNTLAPANRATAIVAGDARWVGVDVFKFGKNLFRYDAMTPTRASIIPMAYLVDEAPRFVLLHALRSVSLDWCTSASVLSLGGDTVVRRTLLLLYDLSRLHPRPEIEVRQHDIADMLGVTRQTLVPVLKKLEERGLVSLGYREIVIGDPKDLVAELRRKRGPSAPRGRP